jgi:hypothetical protein
VKGGWELDDSRMVTSDGCADSMIQFQLESEDNGIKHCSKMKWRQRAHHSSMRRKCDTA